MKKEHNKAYHDKSAKKHHLHNLKRKTKIYNGDILLKEHFENINTFNENNTLRKERILTPKNFSFIYNIDESLAFFNDFQYYSKHVNAIFIDMRETKKMTMEVLLYLISLQKINKNQGRFISIHIKPPREDDSLSLMSQSGFSKYFKAQHEVPVDEENIFEIQDKESNQNVSKPDEDTCSEAIDFVLKYHPNYKFSHPKFRHMFEALAEMMTNTDNHAYDNEGELRNWYLFAAKLEKGISFYFFDNGKGVLDTAKKTILESTLGKISFSLGHESLLKATLNGDYRSATGKKHRNKGLPQINKFLIEDGVSLPIIITNKISGHLKQKKYVKNEHNFSGTLFVWILEDEKEEELA